MPHRGLLTPSHLVHAPPRPIMDPPISLHTTPKAWFLDSVLAPYADAFAAA